MIWIYIKKYYGYVSIFLITTFSFLLFYLSFKGKSKTKIKNLERKFLLGEIKGSLKEKQEIADIELAVLKKKDIITVQKLDKIKKVKNVEDRRKRINELLKTVPIILILLLVSCAVKETEINYPSFLPPKIEAQNLELQDYKDDLEDVDKYGRIAFSSALLVLEDGSTLMLNGGFAFDDSETLKYIHTVKTNQILKSQVEILYNSYSNLYDASIKVEKIWQEQLSECSQTSILEEYKCELCFTAGVSSVLGVLYSVDAIIQE